MTRFCLDTSAYSRFQRGDARAIALIDSADWIGMPAIVIGELHAGFLGGAQRERNVAVLGDFLANTVVEVLPVDEEVGRHFADIVIDLRASGRPIPTNDIWIAATAARAGAMVLAADVHFTAVSRVGSVQLDR